jgi:hypothetical protein
MAWCNLLIQVDALCPKRGSDGRGGSEQDKRVVTTLLTLLDGLHHPLQASEGKKMKAVLVIATTNKPDSIDSALRRPGRYMWLLLAALLIVLMSFSGIYNYQHNNGNFLYDLHVLKDPMSL